MQHNTLNQFVKAQFSSLGATAIDLTVTALLFRLAAFTPFWSTAAGAMCGGIINCIANYEWTFRGTDRTRRGVAIRYIVVWGASIFLNAWGMKLAISLIYHSLTPPLGDFLVVRFIIAIAVAIVWNFNLQKRWVYKK